MTDRAVGQVRCVKVKIPGEPHAFQGLFLGWFPIQIEDFRSGAQARLGLTMAAQTPFHEQRLRLRNQRHLVYLSVTGGAADTFVHVNSVVEIHVVGQIMDPVPADRSPGGVTVAHRLQQRTIDKNL